MFFDATGAGAGLILVGIENFLALIILSVSVLDKVLNFFSVKRLCFFCPKNEKAPIEIIAIGILFKKSRRGLLLVFCIINIDLN
tara:strand:+ start:641 stop:892 length:252 start_codon:yes stop_codon:yes gene_type:complete